MWNNYKKEIIDVKVSKNFKLLETNFISFYS